MSEKETRFEPKFEVQEAPYLEEYMYDSVNGYDNVDRIYFDKLAFIGELVIDEKEDANHREIKKAKLYLYKKGNEEGIAIQLKDEGKGKNGNADFVITTVTLVPFFAIHDCINKY